MEALKLATPITGISIKGLIVQMEPGEQKPFPMKNDQTVRSAISSSIKVDYPEREYTTNRMVFEDLRVLMVKRIK